MRKKLRKLLITGGAGFIGSEFVRQAVAQKYSVCVVDKITYAGDRTRLKEVKDQISFYKTDICNRKKIEEILKKEKPDVIVHFAAETHVDRSIQDVSPFIATNVIGTQTLIELAREHKIDKFIHISTDEIYGSSRSGFFTEESPMQPNNPYSATKASAELLVRAAMKTFQFPAIIIRPSNNYGYWQYPEKLIPVITLKALHNNKVPVYGKGKQIREWLHVSDCAAAIHLILKKGKIAEAYNIGSLFEAENIQTVKTILKALGKPQTLIRFVKDRPGHDFRYSLDCSKIKKLGWEPKKNFTDGLKETIHWYQNNLDWFEKKSQDLKKYWEKIYKT